ncbi:MAG: DNA glycosylase, partial [Oscillospiraceae bacterium]
MDFIRRNNDIYLLQGDFELGETLDCGQAFRWEKITDGYDGFFLDRHLTVTKKDDFFIFHDTSEEDFIKIWAEYFDLNTDYRELKRVFSEDETLKKACEFAGGIRLLKQDKWEALCSFIISQNNNIPRIKGIISRLCEAENGFPTAEKLAAKTADDLGYLRSGFRAKYIIDAAKKTAFGEVSL